MSTAQGWRMDRGMPETAGGGRGVSARAVVLVSADIALRQRLKERLTQLRWSVREAGGGAEALALAEALQPEAMLVDGWLPDLEAGEFVGHMSLIYPAMDLLRVDGTVSSGNGARSPRRNELLHVLRAAEGMAGPVKDLGGAGYAGPTKVGGLATGLATAMGVVSHEAQVRILRPGVALPEILSSPTTQMAAARAMNSPAIEKLVMPAAEGAGMQATREPDDYDEDLEMPPLKLPARK